MATSITDYTSLQTYIARLLAREGDTEIEISIPDFIQLCETDLNLNLRAREMQTTVEVTQSSSVNYTDLPAGFMELIAFNDGFGDPMCEVTMEKLQELRYASGSGRAEYFAITDRIEFERKGTGTYDMVYWKELDLATDDTNDILTKYPNLYVYGSCLHAAPFIRDDARVSLWAQYVKQTIKDLNNRATQNRLKRNAKMRRYNILTD